MHLSELCFFKKVNNEKDNAFSGWGNEEKRWNCYHYSCFSSSLVLLVPLRGCCSLLVVSIGVCPLPLLHLALSVSQVFLYASSSVCLVSFHQHWATSFYCPHTARPSSKCVHTSSSSFSISSLMVLLLWFFVLFHSCFSTRCYKAATYTSLILWLFFLDTSLTSVWRVYCTCSGGFHEHSFNVSDQLTAKENIQSSLPRSCCRSVSNLSLVL